MKKKAAFILCAIYLINAAHAQITVNGLLDSSVSMTVGDNFSFGIEEFANIRFQSRIRDRAVVYGAVNLIAAAGDYTANAALMTDSSPINTTAYVAGENYIAGIELERLYFRLNFEKADFDGGLFRLPFGYGQVWGPSDFLNPRNPLRPDARPRAILGAGLSLYPNNDVKLLGFGAMPRNPFLVDGSGVLFGISMDRHMTTSSVQALYSFEASSDNAQYGFHRAGFSVKADIKAGFVMDMLYTYNHEAGFEIDGLSFSAGADYSFVDGKLIVLAEYLYNGAASSTAMGHGGFFLNRHYLYTGFTWVFNDFTNMNIAFISSFDKGSFTPVVTLNHDLFQGAILTITAQMPFDDQTFSDEGSLYLNLSARLRLRF